MTTTEEQSADAATPARRARRWKRAAKWLALAIGVYLLIAYVVLPLLWRHYEHQPSLATAPKTTDTSNDIPGDPLNVGLVGSEEDVFRAFAAAGWHPADPVTLASSLKIAGSVLFDHKYQTAPVSPLFLFGRKQDLAFELEAGKSATHRNHVRLWRDPAAKVGEREFWIGAATFDQSVGLSHYTGQITHHIAADIDAERDLVIGDLAKAGHVTTEYQVSGVGPTFNGRNGGGDWYYTDGELTVAVLTEGGAPAAKRVERLANPAVVHWKNRFWQWLRHNVL